MPSSELLNDVARQLTICNACRYCEGYCAVFPAMELRRDFTDGDVIYLANLCFECRACYHACPYTPPHEYAINLPQAFSDLRVQTYEEYTGPRLLAKLFLGNRVLTALTGLLLIGVVFAAALALKGSGALFHVHKGEGAFYRVLPYAAMLWPAMALSAFWLVALVVGAMRFWRVADGHPAGLFDPKAFLKATSDAFALRYLRGGGDGCNYPDERPSMSRRWLHQALVLGVMLDLASTALAAFYDHFLDWRAPYALLHPVVILGTAGGVLIVVGVAGLLWLKTQAEREPAAQRMLRLDYAFLALLLLTAATGLLLLVLRTTSAMGVLLAVHLGIVALLFLTLPYGKFAHVAYRYAALIKNARET